MPYPEYIKQRTESVRNCLAELGCQPIIFAGAGLSRRYINGPSWIELLEAITKLNPQVKDSIAFLYQKYGNLLEVGEQLIPYFHAWAWAEGKDNFDSGLFSPNIHQSEFVKYFVAKYVTDMTPDDLSKSLSAALKIEIEQLRVIRPHSIITTNYDTLCETIYPDYTRIVGQKIIRASGISVGEIFKIHGCVTDYKEIVLTTSDYSSWTNKKKYLSAKLLTYFLEHPVLIVGYGAQDPNVLAILKDIDEILACPGSLVSNIFYLIFDENLSDSSLPPSDMLLDLGNGSSMRVNAIHANDFSWVYKAFEANSSMENVNPKLLRALMSRTYDLVRHDIPRMGMQVDFATLEQVVASDGSLPKLLGITGLNDPDMFNATYPYTLTAVGQKLGYNTWHGADQLNALIKKENNVDIKASDNQYHIKVKAGDKSEFNKYSEAFVELLRKVQNNLPYDVSLNKKTKKAD
ncbi:MAG: SIR2 family protein [Sulfuricellaceae bacterium]